MKKWLWSIGALVLLSQMVATPALAWEVTQIKTKTLSIAGDVTFTSAFSAGNGETITIEIWPDDSFVTISGVGLVKVTPKPKLGLNGCGITASNMSDTTVDVTLNSLCRSGKSTLHLWLYLSTGEHLGVNVKFGR